jgi:hypothetical protein
LPCGCVEALLALWLINSTPGKVQLFGYWPIVEVESAGGEADGADWHKMPKIRREMIEFQWKLIVDIMSAIFYFKNKIKKFIRFFLNNFFH